MKKHSEDLTVMAIVLLALALCFCGCTKIVALKQLKDTYVYPNNSIDTIAAPAHDSLPITYKVDV